MSEPTRRTPLTEAQCAIVVKVALAAPHGWHPEPTDLADAEYLRDRGMVIRRLDSGEVRYLPSEEFKAAARLNAALGPQIDPGSQN